ncbi:MAG TPA: DUF167 domain-containing protein [Burkholderiales bacterium]|nr:DUF167 domain-containing protein [Burkholderiales bacterium]
MSWYRTTAEGYTLAIHAQPGAKRSEVAGLHGDRLKIRLAAPPVEGRANEALIAFLADELNLPRSKVRVIKGESSREKIVAVLDTTAQPERLLKD